MPAPSYTSLDDALGSLAGSGIALTNGNSNHAPMVAEALCAMGRPDAVMPWIERYRERLLPRPPAGARILSGDWRSALGERSRFTDWAAFFAGELQDAPWPVVLDRWVARLAPGFCAAATHGAIRVGHAVRSLATAETSCRRRELADALASWAATYQELPADQTARALTPRQAIANIPVVPPAMRGQSRSITASLAMLDNFPEFHPAIGLIDVGGDIDRLLSELTELFARIFLANAHDRSTTIVFIHGVTSLAALGGIMPEVSDATAGRALRYAWQAGCALYACFGNGAAPVLTAELEQPVQDENWLVDRALAHGDEHVIKFTEACLRRHAVAPVPAYLAAAARAATMIPPR